MADQHVNTGETRTDLHCTECGKNFIALLDYDIEGNHIVECPHCGHEHCRVIEAGKVTDVRWSSRVQNQEAVRCRKVWKSNVLQAQTNSASHFIRERWLNFGE